MAPLSKHHHGHRHHHVEADASHGHEESKDTGWRRRDHEPSAATLSPSGITTQYSSSREDYSGHALSRTDILDHHGRELVSGPVRFRPVRVDGGSDLQLLVNQYYEVGYDNERKNPAWVAYDLDGPIVNKGGAGSRPGFSVDDRTEAKVSTEDFRNDQGYNRGHMAPAGVLYSRYGREAWLDTFKMSNITPQDIEMNAGIWNQLEKSIGGDKSEVDGWAKTNGKLTVIAGPVFDKEGRDEQLPSGVPVAKENFMVILSYKDASDSYDARSYMIPNASNITDPNRYLTSIQKVEEKTGLNLFAGEAERYREGLDTCVPKSSWPDMASGGFSSHESHGPGSSKHAHDHGGHEDSHRKHGKRKKRR